MRRGDTDTGRSRNRDELGRFVGQSNPRARSQPIEDRSEEESGGQIRGLQECACTYVSSEAQKWFNYKGNAGQLLTDWGTTAGPLVMVGLQDQIL